MAEPLLLGEREIAFLAVLQGAPVVTRDVDLWMRDLRDETPEHSTKHRVFFKRVTSMHGLNRFAVEYRHAREIEVGKTKVRVLPLDRIIASKRAVDRPKNRAVLPVLEDVLRTIKEARPSQYAVQPRKHVRARAQ